jgi:hypothetical protein
MSIKADLIALLETFEYPVFLQGSVNPDAPYPQSFFTFWNFETPEAEFYDNNAGRAVWGFWVYFYSVDPVLIETITEKARKLLKKNDLILQGKPYDIAVDRPTHTGVIFTVYKFEEYPEGNENEESEVLNNG